MRGYHSFQEDFNDRDHIDPLAEPFEDFDYDGIDQRLGWAKPEPEENGELQSHVFAPALRELFREVIGKRYSFSEIGSRFRVRAAQHSEEKCQVVPLETEAFQNA